MPESHESRLPQPDVLFFKAGKQIGINRMFIKRKIES